MAVFPLDGLVGLALSRLLGLGGSRRLLTGGVHLLHNWLRMADLLLSWGLVVEIVICEDHENITQPALVLLGSSNTVCLLEVQSSRHGQIIVQDGLTVGERILTHCLAGPKNKMRPGGE